MAGQFRCLLRRQPLEVQHARLWPLQPGLAGVCDSRGYDQQQGQRRQRRGHKAEQGQRRRINPMRIFEHQQYRPLQSQLAQAAEDGHHRFLAALLG